MFDWEELAQWLVMQGGLGAVAIFLVWHLVTRLQKGMDAMRKSMDVNTSVLMTMQGTLMMHDATVRGINPSTGRTDEERMHQAQIIYENIKDMQEEQKRLLTEYLGM